MNPRPPRFTRTNTLFPSTTLCRSLTDYPAFVRLYDLLIVEDEDLRPLSWEQRREMLEAFVPWLDPERFDISPVIPATSLDELAAIRERARDDAIEEIGRAHV